MKRNLFNHPPRIQTPLDTRPLPKPIRRKKNCPLSALRGHSNGARVSSGVRGAGAPSAHHISEGRGSRVALLAREFPDAGCRTDFARWKTADDGSNREFDGSVAARSSRPGTGAVAMYV